MITMYSMPSRLFHKEYLQEYSTRFSAAMKR